MIFSLNIRGFGGPSKLASLKILFSKSLPDVVFLQETLVDSEKAQRLFLNFLPTWNYVELDPNGRSGGLLVGWNPAKVELYACGTSASIFLEGIYIHSEEKVNLLNCYAPYKDREIFWQPIIYSRLLAEHGLFV